MSLIREIIVKLQHHLVGNHQDIVHIDNESFKCHLAPDSVGGLTFESENQETR